ncbi:MAG: glutathione S-transferase N-terminal domain-containing protein [Sandaracinaceae bacterium]
MEPELVCLAYSPWSEKARWALDHHRIRYRVVPYQPLLGELALRARLRDVRGVVSVPVMRVAQGWVRGSLDIARWADRFGDGSPLFGDADRARRVDELDALAERALEAGRAFGLPRFLTEHEYLDSLAPRWIAPRLARPLVRFGVRRTLEKYRVGEHTPAEHERRLRDALTEIRGALHGRSQGTLLEGFSFADIAVAQALQFVEPANLGAFRMRETGRRGYRNAAIAEEFSDLIAWRDALYADHRAL